MTNKEFIAMIAPLIKAEAFNRGYTVCSTAIAQACIESAFGRSSLGSKYNNFFGMKCGKSWRGKSVNLKTKEEYTPGTLTSVSAFFRVYDSIQDGVVGYYDFISTSRYENLKTARDYQQYAVMLKADGYATSSTYVKTLTDCVEKYGLDAYDYSSVSEMIDDNIVTLDDIAREVIRGKWGNGLERKQRLTIAGYNYREVQKRVNAILRGGK